MPGDLSALTRTSAGEPAAAARVPAPRVRWSTRVALPAGILLVTGLVFVLAAGDVLRPAVAVRTAPVVVKSDTAVEAGGGEVVVQAPGWVEADPFPIAVSALTDGVVADVLVLEGARVAAGEVVATLIDDDARIAERRAEAAVRAARARLAAAEALRVEAQQNWDEPVELERAVANAEARLAERRAALARWPAELERERAHGAYLAANHKRVEELAAAGRAGDIELIEARQADLAQQAAIEATRRREPIMEAHIRELEAEVHAAREHLRLRIADRRALAEAEAAVQRAAADLAAAEAEQADAALRLERTRIVSPADGVVMARLAEPGSKLMLQMDDPRSAQVLRLFDPQKLQVRVDVPLVEAAKVGVGQRAEVIVDVLPDTVFGGEVTRIVREADVQKNTLQVKVAITAPSPQLAPEMLARARFFGRGGAAQAVAAAERLFVPQAAVQRAEGAAFVWLADRVDGVARRRTVTLGGARDGHVVVTEGLQPGDRVIVDAAGTLEQGARIRITE